jgi:hypothetical protein
MSVSFTIFRSTIISAKKEPNSMLKRPVLNIPMLTKYGVGRPSFNTSFLSKNRAPVSANVIASCFLYSSMEAILNQLIPCFNRKDWSNGVESKLGSRKLDLGMLEEKILYFEQKGVSATIMREGVFLNYLLTIISETHIDLTNLC